MFFQVEAVVSSSPLDFPGDSSQKSVVEGESLVNGSLIVVFIYQLGLILLAAGNDIVAEVILSQLKTEGTFCVAVFRGFTRYPG